MGIFRQKCVEMLVFSRVFQSAPPCPANTRSVKTEKLHCGLRRGNTRCAEEEKLGPGLRRGSTRCASAGFTLLEILVALTLLALAMGIIMQIFSRGVNGADLADRYAKAAMLAESRLASVGIE